MKTWTFYGSTSLARGIADHTGLSQNSSEQIAADACYGTPESEFTTQTVVLHKPRLRGQQEWRIERSTGPNTTSYKLTKIERTT
jgi:hypothetical protein